MNPKFKYILLFIAISLMPYQTTEAQIIGNISPEIPAGALAKGSIENGFGFSGLRHADKMRLQKLRERFRELNPENKGKVIIYDIETPMPEVKAKQDTNLDEE